MQIDYSADKFLQNKNCHRTFFGLDVSKTISNLSASTDRPLTSYSGLIILSRLQTPEQMIFRYREYVDFMRRLG